MIRALFEGALIWFIVIGTIFLVGGLQCGGL